MRSYPTCVCAPTSSTIYNSTPAVKYWHVYPAVGCVEFSLAITPDIYCSKGAVCASEALPCTAPWSSDVGAVVPVGLAA